jgi:hypothetical protein
MERYAAALADEHAKKFYHDLKDRAFLIFLLDSPTLKLALREQIRKTTQQQLFEIMERIAEIEKVIKVYYSLDA